MRSLVLFLVLASSLGAGYNLLSQDFDTSWSTTTPPDSWRIHYTGTPGNDAWHRKDALQPPWTGHPTPYAAIYYDLQGDNLEDSLISPSFDCTGYRNITLSCSTVFRRNINQPYTAQLRYSIDGGTSWLLLRDYQETNVGPELETFSLAQATDQPDVRVAWIFEGNKSFISHWTIDDVVVTGESIPEWDIECRSIVSPPTFMAPGLLTPAARFRNNGINVHNNIPVECRLYDDSLNLLDSWSEVILELQPGQTLEVTFTPGYTVPVGQYRIEFWCEGSPDENPANDTLRRTFRVSWLQEMRYDNGTAAGYDTWPLGNYGWGVWYAPTGLPVHIESLKVYLRANGNPAFDRFQLAVVGDAGGVPGEVLFRTKTMTAATGWNSFPVADNHDEIVISDGGFYVFYLQVGEPPECPVLGYDNARSSGASYWQYRAGAFVPDSGGGDYMIRAVINRDLIPLRPFDLRTTHIEYPWYEFVQRPVGAGFSPRARVHNHGTFDLADFAVACTIRGPGGELLYDDLRTLGPLGQGDALFVEFNPWVPPAAGNYSVMVRTLLAGDENPDNDAKAFGFEVRPGAWTGYSLDSSHAWIDSDTATGPAFEWVHPYPESSSLVISAGDEYRIYVPIGFHFPFYDTSYANCYVTTNGWLTLGFDPGTNERQPQRIPDPAAPNRVLAPWWDDLACGPGYGGGRVWARYLGAEPNRRFAVIWDRVNRVGTDTTELLSFQAILHENGQVVFQYLDTKTGDIRYDHARGAAIGLENAAGSDGLTYLYARPPMSNAVNDLENRVRDSLAIRLNPIRRDIAALEIVEPTGYVFPQTWVPSAKIQNYGTVVDDVWAFLTIRPGEYIDSLLVPGLLPGDSAVIEFAAWDATVGTYTVTCSTWLAGDIDLSNNLASATVIVSPWIQRPDIPFGSRRRKVKGATMAYASTTNRIYAFKGSNDEELWRYDIPTGEWTIAGSIPSGPSGRRARYGNALAFDPDHGAEGTLWAVKGGGVPDFYSYDIASRVWTPCSNVVVNTWGYRPPRRGAALAYVPGLGFDGSVFCLVGNNTNLLLRYDIATGLWDVMYDTENKVFQVPWGPRARRCRVGSGMVFADTALFVVKGSNTVEAYSLNPFSLTTRELDSSRLYMDRRGRRRKVKGGASLGYLDGALFLLKGGNREEFWKFRMDQDSWVQVTDIPYSLQGRRRKPKRGSALIGTDSTLYCLKGSHGYEFWEYMPEGDTAVGAVLAARPGRSGVMAGQERPLELALTAAPNPMTRRLAVRCQVAVAGRTRLSVYDGSGRLVRRLVDATLTPGRHSFSWDGLDRSRRLVPAGVYLLRLENGPDELTTKLVIQR